MAGRGRALVAVPVVLTIVLPVMMARGPPFVVTEMLPVVVPDGLSGAHVLSEGISRLRHRALMPGRRIFRKRSHGLVVNNSLQIHPQLFHCLETFGGNVVTALALHLFFLHPPQLFGGFHKYTPQSKGIHRANAAFFRVFGFHMTPFRGCGIGLLSKFSGLRKFRGQSCSIGEKRPAGKIFDLAPVLELEIVLYSSPAREARRFIRAGGFLANLSARGDSPAAHHLLVAQQVGFIVHIDAGANVIGH
jgi:hypothetical protein